MARNSLYESSVRSAGDWGAFFDHDVDVAYFYLLDMQAPDGMKIISYIWIFNGLPDFVQADVDVRWDATEQRVGLFIRNQLWAAYDIPTRKGYGGKYRPGGTPEIPQEVIAAFAGE